jgi:hypothetical protein
MDAKRCIASRHLAVSSILGDVLTIHAVTIVDAWRHA